MATKKSSKSYQVQAWCTRLVTVTLDAKDLEEALIKSKDLKDDDFLTVHGEYLDGATNITGIYQTNSEEI